MRGERIRKKNKEEEEENRDTYSQFADNKTIVKINDGLARTHGVLVDTVQKFASGSFRSHTEEAANQWLACRCTQKSHNCGLFLC